MMERDDTATDSKKKIPNRYDGRGEKGRMDLTPYITHRSVPYPNPSGMILVADPAFIPEEVLETLLAPTDSGIHPVILTDSDFEWRSLSWTCRLELRATAHDAIRRGGERCAICRAPVVLGGLDFFLDGRPVCDECPSDEWKKEQREGYEVATSVVETQPVGLGPGCGLWDRVLADYANVVKEVDGPSRPASV
jgi:hypothetical protein